MDKHKKSKQRKKWEKDERTNTNSKMSTLNSESSDKQEDEQINLLKEKKKQTLFRIEQLKAQLSDIPRYPYLQLPWQNQDPIVDLNEYTKAFHLPERIVPQIHKIDPRTTSIEQLELEKEIMENKIAELFVKKNTEINLNEEEEERPKSTVEDYDGLEEPSKLLESDGTLTTISKVKAKKTKKDKDIMKVFQAERMKLFNINLEKQIEKENYYTLLSRNLNEKKNELESLREELNLERREFKANEKHLITNINELEENIKRLLICIADAKNDFVDKLNEKFIMERKVLKIKFEDIKLEKQKAFLTAKKEIERKLENNEVAIDELRKEVEKLEIAYEKDLFVFEMQIMDEERKLYDRINDDEDRFVEFSQREEDNTLEPLRDSKRKQVNELAELKEKFDEIKSKLEERILLVEKEVQKLEREKDVIELDNEENVRIQTAKLNELLQIERDAREKLRKDLDNYKKNILKIRERNLELRYDLSLLLHCHGINRPFVFSYFSEWPFYAMDRFIEGKASKV